MINYQIKIEREAQCLTRNTPDEIIRYMVQSLCVSNLNHINFLINLWAEYNKFGRLNEAQLEALISFGKKFDKEMKSFKKEMGFCDDYSNSPVLRAFRKMKSDGDKWK